MAKNKLWLSIHSAELDFHFPLIEFFHYFLFFVSKLIQGYGFSIVRHS